MDNDQKRLNLLHAIWSGLFIIIALLIYFMATYTAVPKERFKEMEERIEYLEEKANSLDTIKWMTLGQERAIIDIYGDVTELKIKTGMIKREDLPSERFKRRQTEQMKK